MGDRHGRGRLRTARQTIQPPLLLRQERIGAACNRVVPLMPLPEGRLSEGTGHGSDRATGGAGFGLLWHPAKRRSAFSEVGGCSRTARRSRRRFERALTYGARFRAGAGGPRKGSAARQGAGKPVSRLTRFISQGIVCCCASRSARERCRLSIYRALRPWPSAADGRRGRRKSVTRT
jgi:hypothetical protein